MKPFTEKVLKDFPKCPEGQFIARLVGIIDMGTQETEWQGTVKHVPKIYLQFEVYAENEDGKPVYDPEGKPFLIGQEFTASMAPKGKLLPFINTWRGKPLESKDFPFDFSRMLDRCGLMTVVQNKSADGSKVYANINGMTPVPKKLAQDASGKSIIPEAVAERYFFDLDSPDWDEMLNLMEKKMWDGIKGKIMSSPEFLNRMGRISEDNGKAEKGASDAFDDPAF